MYTIEFFDKEKNSLGERTFRKEQSVKDLAQDALALANVRVMTITTKERKHFYIIDGKDGYEYLFSLDTKDIKKVTVISI